MTSSLSPAYAIRPDVLRALPLDLLHWMAEVTGGDALADIGRELLRRDPTDPYAQVLKVGDIVRDEGGAIGRVKALHSNGHEVSVKWFVRHPYTESAEQRLIHSLVAFVSRPHADYVESDDEREAFFASRPILRKLYTKVQHK